MTLTIPLIQRYIADADFAVHMEKKLREVFSQDADVTSELFTKYFQTASGDAGTYDIELEAPTTTPEQLFFQEMKRHQLTQQNQEAKQRAQVSFENLQQDSMDNQYEQTGSDTDSPVWKESQLEDHEVQGQFTQQSIEIMSGQMRLTSDERKGLKKATGINCPSVPQVPFGGGATSMEREQEAIRTYFINLIRIMNNGDVGRQSMYQLRDLAVLLGDKFQHLTSLRKGMGQRSANAGDTFSAPHGIRSCLP